MNDSSIKNSEISEDPSREEIVAYLDGETSDEERRVIEQRLANDENYRQQLHQLERAWDMLDVLPQSQVDPSFVHTTMEMVAVTTMEMETVTTVEMETMEMDIVEMDIII